jgi:hypothetical protein
LPQGKPPQQVSSACQLAQATAGGDSLLDQLGTGLSGLDASGQALSALATQAPKDISLAANDLGETASRFAGLSWNSYSWSGTSDSYGINERLNQL